MISYNQNPNESEQSQETEERLNLAVKLCLSKSVLNTSFNQQTQKLLKNFPNLPDLATMLNSQTVRSSFAEVVANKYSLKELRLLSRLNDEPSLKELTDKQEVFLLLLADKVREFTLKSFKRAIRDQDNSTNTFPDTIESTVQSEDYFLNDLSASLEFLENFRVHIDNLIQKETQEIHQSPDEVDSLITNPQLKKNIYDKIIEWTHQIFSNEDFNLLNTLENAEYHRLLLKIPELSIIGSKQSLVIKIEGTSLPLIENSQLQIKDKLITDLLKIEEFQSVAFLESSNLDNKNFYLQDLHLYLLENYSISDINLLLDIFQEEPKDTLALLENSLKFSHKLKQTAFLTAAFIFKEVLINQDLKIYKINHNVPLLLGNPEMYFLASAHIAYYDEEVLKNFQSERANLVLPFLKPENQNSQNPQEWPENYKQFFLDKLSSMGINFISEFLTTEDLKRLEKFRLNGILDLIPRLRLPSSDLANPGTNLLQWTSRKYPNN